jgi:hypothetical protein
MSQFYVYAHLKPDMTPFYIGKGKNSRALNFKRPKNKYYTRVVNKYGMANILVEVMLCNTEAEAFLREQLAIKALRKAGKKLCNMTDGGEGTASYWTKAARNKQSKKIATYMSNPEVRAQKSAVSIKQFSTKKARKAMSAARKGKGIGNKNSLGKNLGNTYALGSRHTDRKPISNTTRLKMRLAKLGKPSPHRMYYPELRVCLKCGIQFICKHPNRTGRGKYCSTSCSVSAQLTARHAKNRSLKS